MTSPEALVAELRARGVQLRAVGDRLRYRPASALSPTEVEILRQHKEAVIALLEGLRLPAPMPETPLPDLITRYKVVLSQLYELGAQGGDADPPECRRLLQEQQRLHDDLGPEFARAVDRQCSRVWAARNQRCPSCGLEGIYHDPDSGETIPIDIHNIVMWTRHEPTPPVPPRPEGTRSWPEVIEGLGARVAGTFTPCATCGEGSFVKYGGVPLCRACALREQR